MADHRVPSQRDHHISANPCPRLSLHHPHVAGDGPQDVHWEGVPQPVVMQGELQHPRPIDAPYYNAERTYHHPSPPCRDANVTYVHMHRDAGVSETNPAHVHPVVPVQEIQETHDGLVVYGAQLPAAHPPGAFPGVWAYPATPANRPPENGLRNLANRYLNNPDTYVNMLRIEPGPGGRFEVWIVLELADVL